MIERRGAVAFSLMSMVLFVSAVTWMAGVGPARAEVDRDFKSAVSIMLSGRSATLRDAPEDVEWAECKVTYGGGRFGSITTSAIDFSLMDWTSLEFLYMDAIKQDVARLTGRNGVVHIEFYGIEGATSEELERATDLMEQLLSLRGMQFGTGDTLVIDVREEKREQFENAVKTIRQYCPGVG